MYKDWGTRSFCWELARWFCEDVLTDAIFCVSNREKLYVCSGNKPPLHLVTERQHRFSVAMNSLHLTELIWGRCREGRQERKGAEKIEGEMNREKRRKEKRRELATSLC